LAQAPGERSATASNSALFNIALHIRALVVIYCLRRAGSVLTALCRHCGALLPIPAMLDDAAPHPSPWRRGGARHHRHAPGALGSYAAVPAAVCLLPAVRLGFSSAASGSCKTSDTHRARRVLGCTLRQRRFPSVYKPGAQRQPWTAARASAHPDTQRLRLAAEPCSTPGCALQVSVVNEAVAGHGVNQVELRTMDVSFVPQGVATAEHTTE